MSKYNKTVNLGDKAVSSKKNKQIEKLYVEDKTSESLSEMKQPKKKSKITFFKKIVWTLLFIFLLFIFYSLFFKKAPIADKNWHSIKLVNGEVYYGQIYDYSNDPITIENVYYNYDQEKKEKGDIDNLRLVKKGKETYGPSGTMKIIRSQVLYFEELKEDSKVLRAILDYEK